MVEVMEPQETHEFLKHALFHNLRAKVLCEFFGDAGILEGIGVIYNLRECIQPPLIDESPCPLLADALASGNQVLRDIFERSGELPVIAHNEPIFPMLRLLGRVFDTENILCDDPAQRSPVNMRLARRFISGLALIGNHGLSDKDAVGVVREQDPLHFYCCREDIAIHGGFLHSVGFVLITITRALFEKIREKLWILEKFFLNEETVLRGSRRGCFSAICSDFAAVCVANLCTPFAWGKIKEKRREEKAIAW